MSTTSLPSPAPDELVVTNLLVCDDVEASTRFYGDVLGATAVRSGGPGPTIVKLANAWIVLVEGGGDARFPRLPGRGTACYIACDKNAPPATGRTRPPDTPAAALLPEGRPCNQTPPRPPASS